MPGSGGEIPWSPAFLFGGRGAMVSRLRMTEPVIPTCATRSRAAGWTRVAVIRGETADAMSSHPYPRHSEVGARRRRDRRRQTGSDTFSMPNEV